MNSYLPHYLKFKNTMLLFNLIRSRKTISRGELVRLTGMSFPTVLKIIDQLLALGIIIELDEIESNRGAGRRGHLLQFYPQAFYAIGLEFEGNMLNAGLVDLDGTSQYCRSVCISDSHNIENIEQAMITEITNLLATTKNERKRVIGIGISLPAVVDTAQNTIVHMDIHGITKPILFSNAFPKLSASFTLPILVGNDVNLACKGEAFLRKRSDGYDNLFFVTLSTGLGAGIMINGNIWEGSNHNAGEVGHMFLCDPRGLNSDSTSIEKLINIEALSKKFGINFYSPQTLSSTQVETVCDYLCPYLSVLLVNQVHLLDINRIVLSGTITNALGYTLFEKLQAMINEKLRYIPATVEPSLSRDVGIIGATVHVFDNVLPNIFQEKGES